MTKIIRLLVVASLFVGSAASATVVSFEIFPTSNPPNDCAGYYSNPDDFSSCIIYAEDLGQGDGDISSIIVKYDVEEGWEISTNWPDFDETSIDLMGTMQGDSSGSWSYGGDEIRFWVIKSSTGFRVYYDTDDAACSDANASTFNCMVNATMVNGGDWTTINQQGISHISFYNSEVIVPEPGTLALIGLGLLGMSMRRRAKK